MAQARHVFGRRAFLARGAMIIAALIGGRSFSRAEPRQSMAARTYGSRAYGSGTYSSASQRVYLPAIIK